MAHVHIEKVGGLAGFGMAGGHVRSQGQVDTTTLSAADQQAVEALFQLPAKPKPSAMRDGFHYRITRTEAGKTATVEVPEAAVPAVLVQSVKDELV